MSPADVLEVLALADGKLAEAEVALAELEAAFTLVDAAPLDPDPPHATNPKQHAQSTATTIVVRYLFMIVSFHVSSLSAGNVVNKGRRFVHAFPMRNAESVREQTSVPCSC